MALNTHTANVFLPGCLGPVKREIVLADEAEAELAALREELATAKRNEHNSEVAYKAAIEKQEELREEVAMLRDTYEAPFKPGGTTLQQRLTAAESELSRYQEGNAKLVDRLDAAEQELATLRDQHAEQSCIFCNNSGELLSKVKSLSASLTAAEQRNATLREALEDLLKGAGSSPGSNKRYAKARAALEPSHAKD